MGEDETNWPVEPPPLGGQTRDAGLIPTDIDNAQRDDLASFVGPNASKFVSPPGRSRRSLVCLPGFLFPVAWFLYRKMYGWAALACALPIFAGALDFGVLQRPLMSAPSFIGLAGRQIYVRQARRTIARIRAGDAGRPEADVREVLARAGGVSTAGAIVGGAIMFCGFVIGLVAGFKARHP